VLHAAQRDSLVAERGHDLELPPSASTLATQRIDGVVLTAFDARQSGLRHLC